MREDRRRSRSRSPSSRHKSHHRHHDSRNRRDEKHRRPRSSDRDSDRHERKRKRTPDASDRDRGRGRDMERRHHRDRDGGRDRERDRGRETQPRNGYNVQVKSEEDKQLEALRRGREERDRQFLKQEHQNRQQQTQFRPEREDVQYQEWLSKEDEFMLSQAKKRAVIRVRENRAKPIDHFVINLNLIEEDERPRLLGDDEIEGDEFYITSSEDVLEGLGPDAMAELRKDIEEYIRLETSPRNMEYWKAVMIILNDHQSKSTTSLEARAVNTVVNDINKLLETKTLDQLEKLEDQIQTKLRGDEPVDVDYWEQLLRSLKIWKAKAKILAMHAPVLAARPNPPPKPATTPAAKANPFDPSYFADDAVHDDLLEDNEAFTKAAQAMFDTETTRIVEEGVEMDEPFNVEAEDVVHPEPTWTGQYKPRKPKFFNTVVMGYEWNKYNQTHYDEANPPPKVVQGYKFNIFYPNLVDTSKTPTYKVERNRQKRRYVGGGGGTSAGEDETCILRFIGGPPYQDIAFRIIDRDWDYSSRFNRGFKSSFDKGILQLHFQFKKVFYRK